jgi:hypothetical protein
VERARGDRKAVRGDEWRESASALGGVEGLVFEDATRMDAAVCLLPAVLWLRGPLAGRIDFARVSREFATGRTAVLAVALV